MEILKRFRLRVNRVARRLSDATVTAAPSESTRRVLEPEEIKAIYEAGSRGRWMPDWELDDKGRKIGYKRSSTDASGWE